MKWIENPVVFRRLAQAGRMKGRAKP
eukprot:SAG11_NODE_23249_length_392_cov_0.883959_1_plen_25_part_01